MNKEAMVRQLKLHIIDKHGTQAAAAEKWGVSESVLSRVMNHRIFPTEAMLDDIGLEMFKPEPIYKRVKKGKAK
jgi:predicted XRE-type DNA-binding protein